MIKDFDNRFFFSLTSAADLAQPHPHDLVGADNVENQYQSHDDRQ